MGADEIRDLRRRGEIEIDHEARLHFRGDAARLYRWFEDELQQIVLAAGATPFPSVDTIDRMTLETAGYFATFPDGAIATPEDGTKYFAPAACYQVYPAMRGQRLDIDRVFSVVACCGRREARAAGEVGRLQRFRMREAVLFGSAACVSSERDAWMERVSGFAASLALPVSLEKATDPFFGQTGRGRRLMQQLKSLKYELRVDAGSAGRLALASFNLHESFFTTRFGIGPMPDGCPAVSGCVAFGIERWTLAWLAQHGLRGVTSLIDRSVTRSTTST